MHNLRIFYYEELLVTLGKFNLCTVKYELFFDYCRKKKDHSCAILWYGNDVFFGKIDLCISVKFSTILNYVTSIGNTVKK